ncbi:hypothetical protein HZC00_01870 [Candidatus Kaiserbacteria bacterium]|nr:hypothetical protein [Candidatus Kaiserbacteria bacterium]
MFQVFSVFPGLLYLSPFATALIRVAAGYAFLYMANSIARDRHKIAELRDVPMIGRMPLWLVWISVFATGLIGALLAVGLYTQVAAIFGALLAVKHYVGIHRYTAIIPLSRGTYTLLFVICISLIISGAGTFAFDLPL